jgi:hypothetical protein
MRDHVGFVDALPASDRRTVEHLAVDEEIVVDVTGRDRDVLLLAARVAEPKVRVLDLVVLDQLDDISGRRHRNLRKGTKLEKCLLEGLPCGGLYNGALPKMVHEACRPWIAIGIKELALVIPD